METQKIILGVSGSIAAYKALSLVRLLIKSGWEVRVVMTKSATEFVSPLSFSTLSKKTVSIDIIDGDTWSDHVELGLWADLMVVAPATAATLSRMAAGLSDNMLVATYLSAKCPVCIAPAMDLDMWKHPSTERNIALLESYGNHIIPVGHGELASGLVGDGRMAEPEDIMTFIEAMSGEPKKLKNLHGKNFLITAGPTQESIDPVRFISNHSTGTMGIRLAEEVVRHGGNATLVLGPSAVAVSDDRIKVIRVVTADDMYQACCDHYGQADVAIFAAAVADYAPATLSEAKLKKGKGDLNIPLRRTKDIAGTLGKLKTGRQINVGFALETHNAIENAHSKLAKKNFDMIVLNSLADKGAGFGIASNKVTLITSSGDKTEYPVKSKRAVAQDILGTIVQIMSSK